MPACCGRSLDFPEELVPPEQLIAWCQEKQAQAEVLAAEAAKGRSKTKAAKAADEVERWQHEALVVGAYQAYCTLLQEQGLMDFSWMLRHALGLLDEHPEIVNELRERYQTILVDEYQDTNVLQERVLRHMAGGRATTSPSSATTTRASIVFAVRR